jgi:hypothetical protein
MSGSVVNSKPPVAMRAAPQVSRASAKDGQHGGIASKAAFNITTAFWPAAWAAKQHPTHCRKRSILPQVATDSMMEAIFS